MYLCVCVCVSVSVSECECVCVCVCVHHCISGMVYFGGVACYWAINYVVGDVVGNNFPKT